MKKALALVALVAVIGFAACGGDDKKAKVIGHVDQSSSTTTTTTAKKPSNVGVVGDKIRTARGNELTLYAYEQPTTVGQYNQPDPGKEFAAIDIEGCATGDLTEENGVPVAEDQQYISINPFNYQLQMADNTRVTSNYGKDPALNSAQLTSGQCARGWVTFQVPVGQRPVAVIDTNTGPPNIQWDIG